MFIREHIPGRCQRLRTLTRIGGTTGMLGLCSFISSMDFMMQLGKLLFIGKSTIKILPMATNRIRFMGALSNSGRRCANYIGFYKGIQSAGAAISNNLDARKVSFEAQFISNWVLLAASLIIASPVIFLKIRDHVALEQDLEGTDETMADVAPHVVVNSGHARDNFESKEPRRRGPGFTAV